MNALVGDIVSTEEFFAPVSSDLVDGLIGRYRKERAKIEAFHQMYQSESLSGVIGYFCRRPDEHMPSFNLEIAICGLNSDFWNEAIKLTDVYNAMPQKRRDQWNAQLSAWRDRGYAKGKKPELDLPDFTEEAVRATLTDLLSSRSKFFAERVDGIFRSLSHDHVTNVPEGFGKRMIIAGVTDQFSYTSSDRCGYINDLRNVINKFMGREELGWNSSAKVVAAARRRPGEWMSVDGGALRIRVYMKGTAHLEVHPDMAWRLNCVLASLYPTAIPSQFRTKPKKQPKDFVLFDRILPRPVIDVFTEMERERNTNNFKLRYCNASKPVLAEFGSVIEAIGGTFSGSQVGVCSFDYDPRPVLDEIICSGRIPDHKAHQFYPTPEKLARLAVEMAEIEEGHSCLEPSAGVGGLADFMPKDTLCVEISALNCKVLEAKGFTTIQGDYLEVALQYPNAGYDRVVMNPPYSENRWKLHTEAAAGAVKAGGKLVAILPASAKGSFDLQGFDCEWSYVYSNEFAGTSISVVILQARKG